MDFSFLSSHWMLNYVVIPALICFARICDVSLGTIRIISVSKGMKLPSAVLGFFEVSIWLLALGQIMQNLGNVFNAFAYAAGYAAGNYIGICIEEKLSLGIYILRIMTKRDSVAMMDKLSGAGYGVTNVTGKGAFGPVDVLLSVIKRKDFQHVTQLIRAVDPDAMFTAEEVKSVSAPPLSGRAVTTTASLFRLPRWMGPGQSHRKAHQTVSNNRIQNAILNTPE